MPKLLGEYACNALRWQLALPIGYPKYAACNLLLLTPSIDRPLNRISKKYRPHAAYQSGAVPCHVVLTVKKPVLPPGDQSWLPAFHWVGQLRHPLTAPSHAYPHLKVPCTQICDEQSSSAWEYSSYQPTDQFPWTNLRHSYPQRDLIQVGC